MVPQYCINIVLSDGSSAELWTDHNPDMYLASPVSSTVARFAVFRLSRPPSVFSVCCASIFLTVLVLVVPDRRTLLVRFDLQQALRAWGCPTGFFGHDAKTVGVFNLFGNETPL